MGGPQFVEIKEVTEIQMLPNGKFLPVLNYILNPVLTQRHS